MTLAREIKVTQDYWDLNEDSRKCRYEETFEECTTKAYLYAVQEQCNCVPYSVKSSQNQVKIH